GIARFLLDVPLLLAALGAVLSPPVVVQTGASRRLSCGRTSTRVRFAPSEKSLLRQTIQIVLALACVTSARADMPPALVEMLATAGVPATARSELQAGGTPVWVQERDTSSVQITVAGVAKLSAPARRIADDFFRRDSLLEADILKASGTFSEPAVPS